MGNPLPCRNFAEDDQCYIRKTSKSIERGCLSESGKKCENPAHCYICKGNGCNTDNGNSSNIPNAPSSANMSKATVFSILFITLISVIVYS